VARDLLAWLFHSPRRLLLVLVVPLIVVSLVPAIGSRLAGGGSEGGGAAVHPPPENGTPTTTADPFLEGGGTGTAPPEALAVVNAFLQEWLAGPTATTRSEIQQWHRRLAPYVTPELAAALRHTDPARVPDATVARSPEALRVGEYLSQIAVPMSDGKDLTLTVAWDGEVWRISDIDREGGT